MVKLGQLDPVLTTQCIRSWNKTSTDYPRNGTVAQIFEKIASSHPDAVALVFGKEQISYGELNKRANQTAHKLQTLGVGPETLVGCCIERSIDLVVSLIAILKARAAYVPLDPTYPKQRLDLLLADTRPSVMLTQRSLAPEVTGCAVPHVLFVDDNESPFPDANPTAIGAPTDLAYVMHTSGSTGRPKGVMVENRAIVRLVRDTNFCHFGANEVFLHFAPISFDASTFEIWGALLNGGRLVIMPSGICSLQRLGQVIREHRVTTLWLTAGLFSLMVEERLEDLRPIKQLLAGGDVLSPRHVRRVLDSLPGIRLINGYGPTENTTFTCCHVMSRNDEICEAVPIGRPISNSQVYILDEQLCPVRVGETGEIYAGGDGVARGYLNNPGATAEKFLPNPFSTDRGARMYRTGDLGRWRSDGVVEFLGRVDNQVKILGHRVAPEEVETVLRTYAHLKQVCVVPFPTKRGSHHLIAFYQSFPNTNIRPNELREFLLARLPSYMIPAFFIPLAAFPLLPNGKLDRAALPNPVPTDTMCRIRTGNNSARANHF